MGFQYSYILKVLKREGRELKGTSTSVSKQDKETYCVTLTFQNVSDGGVKVTYNEPTTEFQGTIDFNGKGISGSIVQTTGFGEGMQGDWRVVLKEGASLSAKKGKKP